MNLRNYKHNIEIVDVYSDDMLALLLPEKHFYFHFTHECGIQSTHLHSVYHRGVFKSLYWLILLCYRILYPNLFLINCNLN